MTPEEWILVPKEPTLEMLNAALTAFIDNYMALHHKSWRDLPEGSKERTEAYNIYVGATLRSAAEFEPVYKAMINTLTPSTYPENVSLKTENSDILNSDRIS